MPVEKTIASNQRIRPLKICIGGAVAMYFRVGTTEMTTALTNRAVATKAKRRAAAASFEFAGTLLIHAMTSHTKLRSTEAKSATCSSEPRSRSVVQKVAQTLNARL